MTDSTQAHHVTSFNGVTSSGFGLHSAFLAMFAATTLQPADRVRITGLNDTQWQTLIAMLNDRKPLENTRLSGKYIDES